MGGNVRILQTHWRWFAKHSENLNLYGNKLINLWLRMGKLVLVDEKSV